jgi:sorbitol-6-phosphate 2-dehydrogenase
MRSITSTTLKPLPGAEEREEREYTRNDVVKNKVSVVTGGAQGFGRALAEDLASSGSIVFIADLNYEGAEQVASELNDQVGSKQVFPVEVNVADEQSVENMIAEVVRTAGGIDLFISNAGVLKAGSVKALTAKNFRFVTEVNYIGYFLCVKHASPVMALQARACEEYFTDIIQINSKSGLKGSNKNSAYAGSKFGGIGLTQSFALELIEDHIKVNSICPGNFFEGPLWSDPETGLFVQYLNAGKVPGAKTIEDVKSFYESKVPFGRGCYGSDIIKAVYYLIEQKYETGQAVPVTGGQIMIR